jgi:hypothetical protein
MVLLVLILLFHYLICFSQLLPIRGFEYVICSCFLAIRPLREVSLFAKSWVFPSCTFLGVLCFFVCFLTVQSVVDMRLRSIVVVGP